MSSRTIGKTAVAWVAALIMAVALSVCVATTSGVQVAHADLQGDNAKAGALAPQASAKKITAKGTYTFSGVYYGKAKITSKAVKGKKYKCSAGTLTVKNMYAAFNKSWKKMSGKSFKISVAKNCKFYSVGSSGALRKTASSAISAINGGGAVSLQVVVSGKKATTIRLGAW